jgi:hypothetical protein
MNTEITYSFPDYDPDYQLRAIGTVISNHLTLLENRYSEMKATDYAQLERQHTLGDFYASELQDYFFLTVAISYSITALIAPFLEGLFRHEINSIRINRNGDKTRLDHLRCQLNDKDFWNITCWVDHDNKRKRGIAKGIYQILEALNLLVHFPSECKEMLEMIFLYRNFTLHNGFEALKETKTGAECFYNEIKERCWGKHFEWAYSDGKPWMVNMEKEFINTCFKFCVQVKESFEKVKGI